jgi:excisionase family DNA binding protein
MDEHGSSLDELMTTKEVMEFLSMSRTGIWKLVKTLEMPAVKVGRDWRYRRSEILDWMERYRVSRS